MLVSLVAEINKQCFTLLVCVKTWSKSSIACETINVPVSLDCGSLDSMSKPAVLGLVCNTVLQLRASKEVLLALFSQSLEVCCMTLPLLLLFSSQEVIPLDTCRLEMFCMLQESMLIIHSLKLHHCRSVFTLL